MRATVFFATNRARKGDGTRPEHYAGEAGPAGSPVTPTHGIAMVDGTDLDSLAAGHIDQIDGISDGDFGRAVRDDLTGGRNLLIFVHGFANSFSDGLTRAAFNRDFLAASGVAAADCTVAAFSWPSRGVVINPGDILPGVLLGPLSLVLKVVGVTASPLAGAYLEDRAAADGSGADFAAFINRLKPAFTRIRQNKGRVFLLAHSMGHRLLRGALPALRGATALFDETLLAAADADFAEGKAGPAWLGAAGRLSTRVSQYVSGADQILRLSQVVNGVQRLGRDGPVDRTDTGAYPPAKFRLVDCSGLVDPGPGQGIDTSHQYYRRIPAVRDDMARVMAGLGRQGRTVLT